MQITTKNRKAFIIVLTLFLVFSLGTVFFVVPRLKNNDLKYPSKVDKSLLQLPIVEASLLSVKENSIVSLPIRLKIPTLKIDSVIEYIGLTKDGAVDAPKGASNTGWYNLGPRPGEVGNSIIDGHSGWKGGAPAVFDNLYKIKVGDKVYVESEKGVTITFVVRKISEYNPNAEATDVFISNDGKAHLNLITCSGFWNDILKSHSSRLAVFTDKE